MNSEYFVSLIYESSREENAVKIEDSILKELKVYFQAKVCNYFDTSFNILHNQINTDEEGPKIILFFGTENIKESQETLRLLNRSITSGIFILPVIDKQEDFNKCIPDILKNINAFYWKENEFPEKRLVRKIFENLGIDEKQRRVFISYRRKDGLGMADQILDRLSRQRFNVFLDKYDVEVGHNIQQEIYESMEDKAFLVVIESPDAHNSQWISKEIIYALTHEIPVFLLSWCFEDEEISNAIGLPKRKFDRNNDLIKDGKFYIIKEDLIEEIICEIESYHSYGINQRRNDFIRSIEKDLKPHYSNFDYLENWIIYFTHSKSGGPDKLITLTPRIPQPYDLYNFDNFSTKILDFKEDSKKILYHKSDYIPKYHNKLLKWIIKDKKNIEVLPY